MIIKRLKTLRVNSIIFNIHWSNKYIGGHFSYKKKIIEIGTKEEARVLEILCHELMEISAIEVGIRYMRPDGEDYIFVYDHRQYDTMTNIMAGLLKQFL